MSHYTLIQPFTGMTKVDTHIRPAHDRFDGRHYPHLCEVTVLEDTKFYRAGEQVEVFRREVFTEWRFGYNGTTIDGKTI